MLHKDIILRTAIDYINQGYSVIPVGDDKKPLIPWKPYQTKIATPEEVVTWTQQFPDMQIAIVTGTISGLVVVDIEEGGDIAAFPSTRSAKTGGNGYHLYYKHPGFEVHNAVRITNLVDIRGDGGYVVAPPSASYKGTYEWINNEEVSLYPGDVIKTMAQNSTEKLVKIGERNNAAAQKMGELINQFPGAEEREVVWHHLQIWNQTELEIPLEDEELHRVFDSIAKTHNEESKIKAIFLKPFTLQELYDEELPPIEWLIEGMIPLGAMGGITGDSNSYKSFLTQSLANAIATNSLFLNHFVTKPGKVLIIDQENNRRIINKRFKDMGIAAHGDIYFLSQESITLDNKYHLEALKRVIEEIQPTLVVFDSLIRFHGRDENSSSEMRHIMKEMQGLVTPTRTVIFIHHHKKAQNSGQSTGSAGVRGAGDIFNALDFHLSIKRNSQTLTIQQHKLRVQAELKPFNVTVQTSPNVAFDYNGEDTSRQDKLEEVKNQIMEMLFNAAGEEISRPEIIKTVGASTKLVSEALRKLQEKNSLSYRLGAHGKHLYRQVTEVEEEAIPY